MRKSKCRHCVRGVYFIYGRGPIIKMRVGWVCEIDEYDDKQCRCGKNFCNYYERKTEDKKDVTTIGNKG